MKCILCQQSRRDWEEGDDSPVCFLEGRNWNCATVNAIRALCYEGREPIRGVHFDYRDDLKWATIDIAEIQAVDGLTLWLSWWKNRGHTDAMWVLSDKHPPRVPHELELLAILMDYAASNLQRLKNQTG